MFKGSFPAFLFYGVGATCAILSLFGIYYLSQYYHHEPPFPHRTISQVAQHYPEYLIFRISTITGSVLIVLGWLANYFFLETVSAQNGVYLKSYHARVPLTAGITAGCLLMGSTSAIDTGRMPELFHQICATSFFILTFFAQIYNTVIVYFLSVKTRAISKPNLYIKYFILFLLLIQLIQSSTKGLNLEEIVGVNFRDTTEEGLQSDRSNFIEWTLTATIISMFLSIGMDAWKYQFVYVEVRAEEENPLMIDV